MFQLLGQRSAGARAAPAVRGGAKGAAPPPAEPLPAPLGRRV